MSSKRSIILSGVVAAIVAIALIGTAAFSGVLARPTVSTTQSTSGGSGTLAVLLTDPPTVPIGTTALFATYSDVKVHVNGAGNNSGWIDLHSSGTINLMGVINATQTIASAKIQSGVFNGIGFNLTSATITYQGKNYSAGLVYQHNILFVPIPGGIQVQDGQTAVTVIDLTPTVLLVGDPSNPSFVLIPAARGYVLPANSVGFVHVQVGERDDMESNPALHWIIANSKFQITGATLTNSSLSVTVKNTGNTSLVFRGVALASTQSTSGGSVEMAGVPAPSISEYFAVASDGTLVVLKGNTTTIYQTIAANGYSLAPNASATFTYKGAIALGILTAYWHPSFQTQSIVVGQQYILKVLASGMVASTSVTATSG